MEIANQLNERFLQETSEAIVLRLPPDAVDHALTYCLPNLVSWAREFGKPVELYSRNSSRPYRITASMEPEESSVLTAGLHISLPGFLSAPILQTLGTIASHPEEKWVLVRLADHVQVAMSAACQSLVIGKTVEQAIGRRRETYWYLPDLEEVNRRTRQELEPNNSQSAIVAHWIGTDPETRTHWRRFTYRYSLVQDNDGTLYHLGQNLDVEPVQAPLGVR